MTETGGQNSADTEPDGRDNLFRLLNLGRRRRTRVSRRYSYIVRGLRFILPLAAFALIAVVVAWPEMDTQITPVPKKNIIPQNMGRNELVAPHFTGTTKDKNPYDITAAHAVQSPQDARIAVLEKPVAKISMKGGTVVTIGSDRGVYRQDKKILLLDGGVTVRDEDGNVFRSARMNVAVDSRVAWTDAPVTGAGPQGTLAARAMNANNATGVVVFTGPAKLVLTPSGKGLHR